MPRRTGRPYHGLVFVRNVVAAVRRDLVVGVGLVQPLPKTFDALGHVAHQIGNLAAPAEQENGHDHKDQDVPDAERTHDFLLRPAAGLERPARLRSGGQSIGPP
jgi:hypothetical protein